ncbi:30S ribosomal protein S8 [Candidatus Woesearchaeota archaeon]|nr:30S ribosomal protein S8 [Candidatus Woesearchaeota archaeon]
MEHDVLARALSAINNAGARGKTKLVVKPVSKLLKAVLSKLKKEKYIEDFKFIDDKKGGIFEIKLSGTINKIGAIKPKFSVTLETYEKYEKRYLPAKDFGRIIVSTPKGVLTHIEAKDKNLGGILLAYVY